MSILEKIAPIFRDPTPQELAAKMEPNTLRTNHLAEVMLPGQPVLPFLDRSRIVSFSLIWDGKLLLVGEECDGNFNVGLTRTEALMMIAELRALVMQMPV